MEFKEKFRKKRVQITAIGTSIFIIATGLVGINLNKRTNCRYENEKKLEESCNEKNIHNYELKEEQNAVTETRHKIEETYECTDCGGIMKKYFAGKHNYELLETYEDKEWDIKRKIYKCIDCDYIVYTDKADKIKKLTKTKHR